MMFLLLVLPFSFFVVVDVHLNDFFFFFKKNLFSLFLPVSEPERAVPEQVKESGRMHTDCELLPPQETALIGGLLLLLVFKAFFFCC